MSRYISSDLRLLAAKRADFRCEYCRLPESESFYIFQIDHIESLKHGGKTELENLAFCCAICNRNKGSDLGTRLFRGGPIVRFFNPRTDDWFLHFEADESGAIYGKTQIGEATVKIFGFNHPDNLMERKLLFELGKLP